MIEGTLILGKNELIVLAALSLNTLNLILFRDMSFWHMTSFVLAVGFFRDIWPLLLIEYICLDIYANINKEPTRTLNLNLLMIGTWIVHIYRHELRLPDIVKTHCFFFGWALLFIYIKNKLLLVYRMVREEGKPTR